MKKILIPVICVAVALIIAAAVYFIFFRNISPDVPENTTGTTEHVTEPVKVEADGFKSIKLSLSNMMAGYRVLEAVKTPDGVRLMSYFQNDYWSDKENGFVENRDYCRDYEAGDEIYEKILSYVNEYNVAAWDGFHESNPDVLDGEGFSFDMVLGDDRKISAGGSNAWPDNYGSFHRAFENIITTALTDENRISAGSFSVSVPESWYGKVQVKYTQDSIEFGVSDDENSFMYAFCILYDGYDYAGNEDDDSHVRLGVLKKDGEEIYLTAYLNDIGYYGEERTSGEKKEILGLVSSEAQMVFDTVAPENGYKFKAAKG